jgi:O-antigen/teichoic acid export membrane protein
MFRRVIQNPALRAFLLEAAKLLSVSAVGRVLRYASNILVARSLTVVEFGTYSFFFQAAGYVGMILENGISTSTIFIHIRKKIPTNVIFSAATVYILVSSTFLCIVTVFLSVLFPGMLRHLGPSVFVWALMPYVILLIINNVLLSIMRARRLNASYNWSNLLFGAVFITVNGVAYITIGLDLGVALASALVALAVWLAFNIMVTFRSSLVPFQFEFRAAKKLVSFGTLNLGSRLLSNATQLAPYIVLKYWNAPVAMGLFGVAVFFMSIFRMIGQSVSLLLTAKLSELSMRESRRFALTLSAVLGVAFCGAIPLIGSVLERVITVIYGERYQGAVGVSLLAMVAAAFEVALGILLRPELTSERPSFRLVYPVQFLALAGTVGAMLVTRHFVGLDVLNAVGVGMVVGSGSALCAALVLVAFSARAKNGI